MSESRQVSWANDDSEMVSIDLDLISPAGFGPVSGGIAVGKCIHQTVSHHRHEFVLYCKLDHSLVASVLE
jgi:hypothetical protein